MSIRSAILFSLAVLLCRAAALETPAFKIGDVLKLSVPEAALRKTPVLFTGVVTLQAHERGTFFLQDDTGGIFVVPPWPAYKVKPGTRVTVAGLISGGQTGPYLRSALVTPLGDGEFPAPVPATLTALLANQHMGHWVEVQASLRDAADMGGGMVLLSISNPRNPADTHAETMLVTCYDAAGRISAADKDAVLRIRGVNWRNDNMALYVPSGRFVETVTRGAASVFSAPEVTAASLVAAEPPAHRVRVRGTLAAALGGMPLTFVSGETWFTAHGTTFFSVGTRLLPVSNQRAPQPGEVMEVAGFASLHGGHLIMKDCEWRAVDKAPPPAPVAVSPGDLAAGKFPARLVTTSGRLVSARTVSSGGGAAASLTLEENGALIEAVLAFPEGEKLGELPRDHLTTVSGVVMLPHDPSGTPRLRIRSAADVKSTTLAFSAVTRRVLEIGGIAAAAALGLLGWIVALRRKVKLQRSEQEVLRESEERFRLLFDRSGDAILLLDGGLFQFTDCNEATVRMLRAHSKAEVCRTHPAQLSPEFQPDGRTSYEKANEMMEAVIREGSHRFEWMHRRKDGEDFLVEVLLTTVQVGDHPLIVTVWREIGERKRAEAKILELNATLEQRVADRTAELARTSEELRKALESERDLSRLKSNFVSMVSHEFRTPLGIISVSSELLTRYRDRLKPEQRDEHLSAITTATKRMAGMMENILVLSRVDTNRLECKPSPIDLPALCRRLVDEMHSITSRSCPIQLSIGPGTEAQASADESILRHILPNLLSNACKYSADGAPVTFTLTREGRDAVFTITDQGIGIPDADQEKLFQSFHRGANVGQTPGTGLGLVIVKRCADLHGGSVSVTSAPGEGTSFKVSLPLYP